MKEQYMVDVQGWPIKVYAASATQAKLAAEYLAKFPPPDLSEEGAQNRMAEASKAHRIRRGEKPEGEKV
jgi:hypothetical protein